MYWSNVSGGRSCVKETDVVKGRNLMYIFHKSLENHGFKITMFNR